MVVNAVRQREWRDVLVEEGDELMPVNVVGHGWVERGIIQSPTTLRSSRILNQSVLHLPSTTSVPSSFSSSSSSLFFDNERASSQTVHV